MHLTPDPNGTRRQRLVAALAQYALVPKQTYRMSATFTQQQDGSMVFDAISLVAIDGPLNPNPIPL